MAQSETRVLTAAIPAALADKLAIMAAERDQSPDAIVRQALSAWVEDEEERYRLTLKAIAQIDAGQYVEDAEVQAWLASLGTDTPLPRPRPK
ncbi:CopG family transcriptional regulator [Elstera cyanobacteriorum]|uniref:CopG family transcriptional regulator n=1 Tax=Elstera cyanobacteriorum TaxID=2022747 RepID=A0A255XIC0_9PROT|nr:ribbon-helix-helix domain-containing protein [Elstera cyanobacteriorum]OYQ16641.1 CopG family transcriptional regulator [Elstera cyanobacteriorum]GFZ87418.1 CopG family transcriptional regulator [Elstera cyanobacteriorum]